MTLSVPGAYERSAECRPFSNNSEWELWAENFCYRCANDGFGIGQDDPNCDLIGIMLCGRTPAEWLRQPDDSPDRWHCIMFRDRDDPGGREPQPVPDPPGQESMFPREPFTGIRMWADTAPCGAVAASG